MILHSWFLEVFFCSHSALFSGNLVESLCAIFLSLIFSNAVNTLIKVSFNISLLFIFRPCLILKDPWEDSIACF